MKIGDFDIEIVTQPYEGGWMSVAYLPDGKQVASAPWDTQEAAEHDVIEQARMRLLPMPQREPAGTFEAAIAQRRADHLLEHCGHCPGDKPGDVTKARCPACGGPGILQDRDGRVNFRCRDCGASFYEKRGETMSEAEARPFGSCECSDPGCPHCHGACANRARTNLRRVDMEDKTGTLFCPGCASDALDSGLFREDRGAFIRGTTHPKPSWLNMSGKRTPRPKASFYPSDGGSAGGGGGITSV